MGAQGIKLSGDDIYFIKYQWNHAKSKAKMLTALRQLFLVPKKTILDIVGEEKLPEGRFPKENWTKEECDILLKHYDEGIAEVQKRLEEAGYFRSPRAIKMKHRYILAAGEVVIATSKYGAVWTDAEDRYIIDNIDKPLKRIAEGLSETLGAKRSVSAVGLRRQKLKEETYELRNDLRRKEESA